MNGAVIVRSADDLVHGALMVIGYRAFYGPFSILTPDRAQEFPMLLDHLFGLLFLYLIFRGELSQTTLDIREVPETRRCMCCRRQAARSSARPFANMQQFCHKTVTAAL